MGRKTKVALTVGAAGVAAWAASKAVAKPTPREGKKALTSINQSSSLIAAGFPKHLKYSAAFSKSAALGIHGFAVDVRLTKDEEIIVFHDEFPERTTDLTGRIPNYTFSELKIADAGYHFTDGTGKFPYRGIGEAYFHYVNYWKAYPHCSSPSTLKILRIHMKAV